jgi:hypothetical protein
MNAKRSAAVLLSSPAAAQRCAEGAGLDGGAVAASTIRHASIAAAAAMIADMISTRAAVFDGPSATARIYTRLTDVTEPRAFAALRRRHRVYRDSLAERPVSREPVSALISLFAGKIQGI